MRSVDIRLALKRLESASPALLVDGPLRTLEVGAADLPDLTRSASPFDHGLLHAGIRPRIEVSCSAIVQTLRHATL